jgi:hypothetical protein
VEVASVINNLNIVVIIWSFVAALLVSWLWRTVKPVISVILLVVIATKIIVIIVGSSIIKK